MSIFAIEAFYGGLRYIIRLDEMKQVVQQRRNPTWDPQACLGLKSYLSDGTRTKFPTPVHILARPTSLPELSRKVPLVVRGTHPNIQKKSLEEKGVNTVVCQFSSQGEILVHKSISKKHTNRYLTSTNHPASAMLGELPSRSARATFHGIDPQVNP